MASASYDNSSDCSTVKISKALSWILRHGAIKEGLDISSDGWVKLSHILQKPKFRNETEDSIKALVTTCPKQRFCLKVENDDVYIRANQGHSIQELDLQLSEVCNPADIPFVIHGTFFKSWPSIQSVGLSRMKRQHIHFSTGLAGDKGVISGMRSSCQILVHVNTEKAIDDGFKFYKSANGVILCPGNSDGFLPVKYFEKAISVKTKQDILSQE